MGWSVSIGRLFGIPIKLHATLIALLAFFAFSSTSAGHGLYAGMLMVLLFASVLAHELGHALVARRFGVRTREIVLLPIGGAAMLEQEPAGPAHELWIALAGPGVSLSLAGVGWLLLQAWELAVLADLAVINLLLGLFNLVPAFPLDGGRVLRAALSHWMGDRRGTRMAARIGRLLALTAVGFGLYGGDLLLAFIGVFVFFAAMAEERSALIKVIVGEKRVADLVERAPRLLGIACGVDEARALFDDHPDLHALPVVFGDRILGVLYKDRAFAAVAPGGTLHGLLDRNFITHQGDGPLLELLKSMGRANSRAAVVVLAGGEIQGTVTLQRVLDELKAARHTEF